MASQPRLESIYAVANARGVGAKKSAHARQKGERGHSGTGQGRREPGGAEPHIIMQPSPINGNREWTTTI